MDTHKFSATIVATVQISDEDLQVLWETAEHHYDGTVRGQTVENYCGKIGILYGERNRRNFYKNPEPHEVEYRNGIKMEFRDIDLMLKTLEMAYLNNDKAKVQRGFSLSIRLRKIIQQLADKSNKINTQLETEK